MTRLVGFVINPVYRRVRVNADQVYNGKVTIFQEVSMNKLSRREFLRSAATGFSALALQQLLAACGQQAPDSPASPMHVSPTQAASPTHTTAGQASTNPAPQENDPTASSTQAAEPTASSLPDLVVARGAEPEELVRRALVALGGMERFVPKGSRVIVKPNICVAYHTYEYAATTNPWVVGVLVKLALEAGAKSVQVLDYPFGGSPQEAYSISGIAEQVAAAGGEMVSMPGFKYVTAKIPQGVDLKKTDAFEDALNADVLIDVPIAKHHGSARLTLGMKNLMGLIQDRGAIHRNLGQRIADLASLFRPTLTVVDAVRILMDNGPTGGNLDDVKKLDTVIASPDIVAADSYATSLFGLTPQDVAYIPAAAAMGLGRSDLTNLKIEEIAAGA
jgi:uncharacterized protein (DUF362 family)